MLAKTLISLAMLVVVLGGIVSLQPAQYRVERSIAISAPAADVFGYVNDLRRSQEWSPWVKFDPAAKFSFEGPSAGTGATSTWSGNNQIGEGRQTIIDSRRDELVRIRLDFARPFKATATAEFALKPERGNTVVTWSMSGENNFVSKAFCLVMNQDKMVGGSFEQGLAQLKSLVEAKKS